MRPIDADALTEFLKCLLPERGMWEIEGDTVKNAVCETVAEAIEMVKNMETIQPVAKDINVLDTISRQQAIDRFNVIRPVDPKKDEYTKGIDVGIAMCIVAVKDQPTIQPEKAQLLKEGTTSDLIDRQAAIDAIVQCTNCGDEDTLRGYVLKHNLDNGWTGGILEALDAVKDLPTAQPEPKEGHWIEGKIYRDVIECYCSECGQLMTTAATVRMNYCPNCGTKMINK